MRSGLGWKAAPGKTAKFLSRFICRIILSFLCCAAHLGDVLNRCFQFEQAALCWNSGRYAARGCPIMPEWRTSTPPRGWLLVDGKPLSESLARCYPPRRKMMNLDNRRCFSAEEDLIEPFLSLAFRLDVNQGGWNFVSWLSAAWLAIENGHVGGCASDWQK